jgi:hypothetical protein
MNPGRAASPAAMRPLPVPPAAPDRVELCILRGLDEVRRGQLPSGEIPAVCGIDGEALYCLSPLPSSLAHDFLACFDPASGRCERGTLGLLAPAAGRWLPAAAARVRQRIRAFIAWQELADCRFSFFGRGSGLAPDAGTTACAAAVLLAGGQDDREDAGRQNPRRHLAALARHRAAGGRYFTYIDREGRGYGALGPRGEPLGDFDRVVNAHVLRFLALAGEVEVEPAAWLLQEAVNGDFAAGSPDHPNPLVFAHAVARAFGPARLTGHETLAGALAPRVLALQRADGSFGGPLATALAVHALLDLELEDEARLAAAGRALVAQSGGGAGTWAAEGYVRQGGGSPVLSAAAATAALFRLVARCGPELAA